MKGSVLDVIIIPIIIFVLIFAVIFTYMFLTQFSTSASGALSAEGQAALQAGLSGYLFWDQAIVILIGGLFVTVLISAAMIDAHPMFFVVSIMLLIIFIFLGSQLANIFIAIAENASISNAANMFPYTITFFQNLPLFILVITISTAIVMFSFGGRRSGTY